MSLYEGSSGGIIRLGSFRRADELLYLLTSSLGFALIVSVMMGVVAGFDVIVSKRGGE